MQRKIKIKQNGHLCYVQLQLILLCDYIIILKIVHSFLVEKTLKEIILKPSTLHTLHITYKFQNKINFGAEICFIQFSFSNSFLHFS